MFSYEIFCVRFTVRDDNCDSSSPIKELVLDKPINGYTVHSVSSLKGLADKGQLWVEPHDGHPKARVRIFYSYAYGRWIATTLADNRQCNNLLSLPIYYGYSRQGEVTYYQSCPLR